MDAASPKLPIVRNTPLLAASVAAVSAMIQLSAAVATLTFVLVTGVEGLLGLGPAVFLSAGALAAFPAGHAMDRFGRVPVLAAGFGLGAVGAVSTGLGAGSLSTPAVILGFALIGCATGTVLLVRTAAGDMYPPERRARGIAFVLFGAVFGAILGPLVFMPLFAGEHLEAEALTVPWLAAGGFMIAGLALVLAVRPDPRRIAELMRARAPGEADALSGEAAPLANILRRPGVIPALLAGVASFSVMVGVMTLAGYVVVGHGHHQEVIFPIVAAHVLGMYALVLVVGDLVDRFGRTHALVGGLLLMGASTVSLVWVESVVAMALSLFGLGLGWNFSFVAATAQLVECTSPAERGTILGLNDLLSGCLGASLALLGGLALSSFGVPTLAAGSTAIVLAPVFAILGWGRRGLAAALSPPGPG